jgi:hypothetical protein
VDEAAQPLSKGNYARGIVEEATRWSPAITITGDIQTPSDTSEQGMIFAGTASTGSGSNSGSSGSNKVDPSTLFFLQTDVVLLVDDNWDMRKVCPSPRFVLLAQIYPTFSAVCQVNVGVVCFNGRGHEG